MVQCSVAKSYANCYLVLHSYLGLLGFRELGEADVRVIANIYSSYGGKMKHISMIVKLQVGNAVDVHNTVKFQELST